VEAVGNGVVWDAAQYERFAVQRERPFHDLIARVPDGEVALAADLGCGTGRLTRTLLERWPVATIYGVDSSSAMLERAAGDAAHPRLHFVQEDLAQWTPPHALDCIVSNAALHWLPNHEALLTRLVAQLAPAGVLAVQVPNNRSDMPHRAVDELVAEPRWHERVPPGAFAPGVQSAEWYVATLQHLGLEVDAWETTYYHQLPSAAAIVEWLKGTTLRPVLTALAAAESEEFLSALSAQVERAYRRQPFGVVFPFRRLFFIARAKV
jgi:trans-aconitate 2-methyltransferase